MVEEIIMCKTWFLQFFPVKCLELGVEVAMGSEWGRNQSGENPLPALSILLMIYQVNVS